MYYPLQQQEPLQWVMSSTEKIDWEEISMIISAHDWRYSLNYWRKGKNQEILGDMLNQD